MLTALLSVLFIGCSGDSDGGGTSNPQTPSNIAMTVTVVGANASNPNGDGSGDVTITVTATNATNYKLLINGETLNSPTGNFSYSFSTLGTNTYTIAASAYNGSNFISTSATVTVYVAPTLVWSDEFNTNGAPDSGKWAYDTGTGSGGWGNNEAQYYTSRPENVIVENGFLKIKTLKEVYNGSNYTSARLKTQGKFSFKYGRVEMRAKLPAGGGTWPAFWMLGDNITSVGWPSCGEIDIMEHVGNQLNKIYGSLHHPGHSGANPDGSNVTISNATTDYHIYALDWGASTIKFYVDGQLFYTFSNSSSVPFNSNFFLIVNCAIGGNFGGTIDPAFTSSTYEIDYIRIFQ